MRGLLKVILGLLGILALALATLPWWLGPALGSLAGRQGLMFERYERSGYTRFVLHNVRFERPAFAFAARQASLDSPVAWLVRRSSARAEVQGWKLALLRPTPPPANARSSASPRDTHARLRRGFDQLRTWLPRLTATDGSVERGSLRVDVPQLHWADGRVTAEGRLSSGDPLHVVLEERTDAFALAADAPTFAAGLRLQWTANGLQGEGTWWRQPFTVAATFGARGWIPQTATWRAENWDLPASQLKLAPNFERVRGHATVEWTGDQFTVAARVAATPAAARVPPLELVANAEGDRTQLRVQALRLEAPFAHAALSAPVVIHFDGRPAGESALLRVTADLAQQPWVEATGKLEGEVRLVPAGAESRGAFALHVSELRAARFSARALTLRGDWRWPEVNVSTLEATLDGTSRLTARGQLDWRRRELSGIRIDADLTTGWLQPLLPAGMSLERARATVEAEGPLEAPRHRGELQVDAVRVNRLRPTQLAARWEGQERALQDFFVTVRAPGAMIEATGLLDERRLELRGLTLSRAGAPFLQLVSPAEFSWRPEPQLSGLRLEGAESSLAVDARLGATPAFFVSGQNLASPWIADWWDAPVPLSRVDSVTARGEMRDHALAFDLQLAAAAEWEGAWIRARLAATGDRGGTRIGQLELADERGLMAYARGRVPAHLGWRNSPRLQLDEAGMLEFEASVAPESPLWSVVSARTGLALEGASLVASGSGTLRQPRGLVRAEVARVFRPDAESQTEQAAKVTDVAAVLHAGREGLELETFTAQVAGHPLRASGRVPLDDDAWMTLFRRPAEFDWRRATAELTANKVALAALGQTFPAAPFTAGELDLALQLVQGELRGHARLRDGETRPLPGLGRMLGVSADLTLQGRRVDVREFAAQLGGEPVRLTGTAALNARNRPQLDLRLEATNVPLVRRPGVLVRTDLDLRAQTPERGPTRISGRVELRDALVMADLAAILPGGPRGTARHPPYFSVPTDPFTRWPLDVRIGGSRAVRVRTTVFSGVATPNFHLTGTLGEPRAVGQLAVDEGRVIFPFASFGVQQGTVRLTEADPTQPQLAVNATARRMGYELRLEAGGTVSAPTLAFSSNPPLESADILLLVTTGQPPAEETAAPTGTQRLTRLGTFLGRGIFQNFGGDEERLEITSGEQVSREGRETYRVEYKLREKLSLTGEYDEYDTYNAGVKYRIYTQEGARRDERK